MMDIEENMLKNKYSNYSKENGRLNTKDNINYFTMEKENSNYCSRCQCAVNKSDIYCKNCGESLEVVKSKRERFINHEERSFKNIASSFDLYTGLKTSIGAFCILLIFSLIIKIMLVDGNNQISRLINPIHIMLFSNLASIDISMNLFMNSSQSSINVGILGLLILPIISFILPYRLFMEKNNTSFIKHIKNTLCTAIIYAIGLGLLAKLSQVAVGLYSGSNSYSGYGQFGFGQSQYSVYIGFNIFSAMIKGFIISFLSILFMGLKREYEKENSIVYVLKLAIQTIIAGYIFVVGILFLLDFLNINYIGELGLSNYANNLTVAGILSQLGMYIWAFANLIPIDLGNTTLSIISLFTSRLSLELTLILSALLALSALIFIITGCKLESKYKSKNIKPVIKFSGVYAVLMGVISILTIVYIGENASSMLSSLSSVQMGFNVIIAIIVSFIYSLIMTLIGYKLNIFN